MLTSKDIITKRDTLSETITRNWDIIKSENVVFFVVINVTML